MNYPHTDRPTPSEHSQQSLGDRLRERRESLGLSLNQVAEKLRLRQQLIEQLEAGQLDLLGATVYVRGYLSSYLKLLGMPMMLVEQSIGSTVSSHEVVPPVLSAPVVRRTRFGLERLVRRTGHVFLTAAIVVPVIWLASYGQLPSRKAEITPLEVAVPAADVDASVTSLAAAATSAPNSPSTIPYRAEAFPVMASLTPTLSSPVTELIDDGAPESADGFSAPELVLNVIDDSWVELRDTAGDVVDMGVFRAGSQHRYEIQPGFRLALGNASGVEVRLNGNVLDVTPYQRANVARFTLREDGIDKPAGG